MCKSEAEPNRSRYTEYDKCRHLLADVLWLAMKDYYDGRTRKRLCKNARIFYNQSIAWFKSKRDDLTSFLGICEVLNLNPYVVRERIFNLNINMKSRGVKSTGSEYTLELQ